MAWSMLEEIEAARKPLSVNQVSVILDVSTRTIRRMIERNEIPYVRIGGSVRFDPRSVAVWLRRKDPMLAVAARSLTA